MRKIKVTDEQCIGYGSFGTVYRISPRKVVKAFFQDPLMEAYVKDEIRGSKLYKAALPILEVVTVVLPDNTETIGLVKRYIPNQISYNELKAALKNKLINYGWDVREDNYRKDNKGRIWRIDTQTQAAVRM